MTKPEPSRTRLSRTDCRDIGQALRVFAHDLKDQSRRGVATKAPPQAATAQAERLEDIAGRFEAAHVLEYSYEAVLAAMKEPTKHGRVTVFDFAPADLRVAAEALRLLRDRLQAVGDRHVQRIGELAAKVQAAAGYWQRLSECIAGMRQAKPPRQEQAEPDCPKDRS